MNIKTQPTITAEEQARRRKVVESAAWAAQMEGLGKPAPAFAALDELWITGQISREDRVSRAHELLKAQARRV